MEEQTLASVLSITDTDLTLHFPEITDYWGKRVEVRLKEVSSSTIYMYLKKKLKKKKVRQTDLQDIIKRKMKQGLVPCGPMI